MIKMVEASVVRTGYLGGCNNYCESLVFALDEGDRFVLHAWNPAGHRKIEYGDLQSLTDAFETIHSHLAILNSDFPREMWEETTDTCGYDIPEDVWNARWRQH